jgi:F420-dependent oxidoreductase-like protein
MEETPATLLPSPALFVLIGAAGSGKSSWASAQFAADQIVSSDRLRAMVGASEEDLSASTDAFALLDRIVELRLGRALTTVVDTLGLDAERRTRWAEWARAHDVAVVAVVFETTVTECVARNRARGKAVPQRVVSQQVQELARQRDGLEAAFDVVIAPTIVRTAPARVARHAPLTAAQAASPVTLKFGLQIPSYRMTGGATDLRARLRAIGQAADEAGFAHIWVMDHLRQIPMFGPNWDDILESYTTLSYLAGVTERVELGTLVTGVMFRNVGLLAKIIATLDVLSGGRAMCGIGAGWFAPEYRGYGWDFPATKQRYAHLEDALQVLPLLWGKGSPEFHGQVIDVPDTTCYPRPLRAHVPILVGGNGERVTLRLAAKYADACNIIGDVDVVARKIGVLHAHCDALGRDRDAVEVTQLSTALVGRDPDQLAATVERLRPRRVAAETYAATVNAGTVDDHIGRFRALADVGVGTAIVSFPDLDDPEPVERFTAVIAAFRE